MKRSQMCGTATCMARCAEARRAMTILELAVVVAIKLKISATGALRYGASTVADVGAHGFARRRSVEFMQARRRAVASGARLRLRLS
jgi:hypothetical protein